MRFAFFYGLDKQIMSFQGDVNLFIVLLLTFTLKAWNLKLSHKMEAVSGLGSGRLEHSFLVNLSMQLVLFVLMADTGFSSNYPCFHAMLNPTSIKVKDKDWLIITATASLL